MTQEQKKQKDKLQVAEKEYMGQTVPTKETNKVREFYR
jgi:hypothetical protein